MAKEKPKVKEYMSSQVESIPEHFTVKEAIRKFLDSGHKTFPITRNGNVVGFLSAKDLLRHYSTPGKPIQEIYEKNVVVAHPELKVDEAARVMFRYGYQKLPVVDDSQKLVGIISNTDVVRSHIERVTPRKVNFIKKLLQKRYDLKISLERSKVPLDKIHPTQGRIHQDELEGRKYELKKGLAEPIVSIKKRTYFVLVDGHHRVVAAKKLGIKELDSYVLELNQDVEVEMEKEARERGILTLEDIEIVKDAQHPLVEITTRLFRGRKSKFQEEK